MKKTESERILVVDDEEAILDLIETELEFEGYEVATAQNGEEALEKARSFVPDLMILDIMLPKKNGYDVCKEVLSFLDIPIILLTAKSDIIDKVLGLELGADDYLTKPFDNRELLARIKAHLRRSKKHNGEVVKNDKIIKNGPLTIIPHERKVTVNNQEVHLTPKEFDLLYLLADNIEQVFQRETLLERIWGYDYFGDTRTVDMHVQRIRKKIDTPTQKFIHTVFGVGYKMRRI